MNFLHLLRLHIGLQASIFTYPQIHSCYEINNTATHHSQQLELKAKNTERRRELRNHNTPRLDTNHNNATIWTVFSECFENCIYNETGFMPQLHTKYKILLRPKRNTETA
jgi:hypothetical protein